MYNFLSSALVGTLLLFGDAAAHRTCGSKHSSTEAEAEFKSWTNSVQSFPDLVKSASPEMFEHINTQHEGKTGRSLSQAETFTVYVTHHELYTVPGGPYLNQEDILTQIDILNQSFFDVGLYFVLYDMYDIYDDGSYETLEDYALEFGSDPELFLNIYASERLAEDGILGYAYLPGGDSSYHGVYMYPSTYASLLPSNPYYLDSVSFPYNLGGTLIHEVGHWAGLDHTFNGGCGLIGDNVADTGSQDDGDNIFLCEPGQNSCGDEDGEDPYTNFMNYTDDFCLEGFSLLQKHRALGVLMYFRYYLLNGIDAVPELCPLGTYTCEIGCCYCDPGTYNPYTGIDYVCLDCPAGTGLTSTGLASVEECYAEGSSPCNDEWIGDGYCDNGNNNQVCFYDGGDCCEDTCEPSLEYGCGGGDYGAYDCRAESCDTGCDSGYCFCVSTSRQLQMGGGGGDGDYCYCAY